MNVTKRLIANILEIGIGIVLSVLGFSGILDAYWSGMGTALIVVGILMLVKTARYKTNVEYKEKMDVEVNDERNKYLRRLAWSWSAYFFVLLMAIGSIVFRILGMVQYSQFSAYCVCLIMILYWISYLILSRKH